jgi:hypothetical protein
MWQAGVNEEQQAYATVAGVPVDLLSVRGPALDALYVVASRLVPCLCERTGACAGPTWERACRGSSASSRLRGWGPTEGNPIPPLGRPQQTWHDDRHAAATWHDDQATPAHGRLEGGRRGRGQRPPLPSGPCRCCVPQAQDAAVLQARAQRWCTVLVHAKEACGCARRARLVSCGLSDPRRGRLVSCGCARR